MAKYSFSLTELASMREDQDGHMMDTCKIQTRSTTPNTFNEQVETWVDGSAISCGLDMDPGREMKGGDGTTVVWDATLRLPIGTTLTAKDRIKITHRHGTASELVYGIVSPIQKGSSGIRVRLKRIDL